MRPFTVVVAVAAVVTAMPLAVTIPAGAAPRSDTCLGQEPTIVSSAGVITGTPGRDVIIATRPATIRSLGGDDIICGSSGADNVNAGSGNDITDSGDGKDTIQGAAGDDTIFGGTGHDTIRGGTGDDRGFGDPGNDTFHGGPGTDRFIPGPGADAFIDQGRDEVQIGGDGSTFSITMSPADAASLNQAGKKLAMAVVPPGRTTGMLAWSSDVERKVEYAFVPSVSGFIQEGPTLHTIPIRDVPMSSGSTLIWEARGAATVKSGDEAGGKYYLASRSGIEGYMGLKVDVNTLSGRKRMPFAIFHLPSVPGANGQYLTWASTPQALPDSVVVYLADAGVNVGDTVTVSADEQRRITLTPGEDQGFIYQDGYLARVR